MPRRSLQFPTQCHEQDCVLNVGQFRVQIMRQSGSVFGANQQPIESKPARAHKTTNFDGPAPSLTPVQVRRSSLASYFPQGKNKELIFYKRICPATMKIRSKWTFDRLRNARRGSKIDDSKRVVTPRYQPFHRISLNGSNPKSWTTRSSSLSCSWKTCRPTRPRRRARCRRPTRRRERSLCAGSCPIICRETRRCMRRRPMLAPHVVAACGRWAKTWPSTGVHAGQLPRDPPCSSETGVLLLRRHRPGAGAKPAD